MTKRIGDASAACPPKKSPSCFHAATSAEPCGADSPCRSWKTNEIQSWLRVPQEHRQKHERRDDARDVRSGLAKPRAQIATHDHRHDDGDRQENRRVLRRERDPSAKPSAIHHAATRAIAAATRARARGSRVATASRRGAARPVSRARVPRRRAASRSSRCAARNAARAPPSRRAIATVAIAAIHPASTGAEANREWRRDDPNGERSASPNRMSSAIAGG